MNYAEAKIITESWNGKDKYFLCNGSIYSEDDVQEAHEYLETLKK